MSRGAAAVEAEAKKWSAANADTGFRVRKVNKGECEALFETPDGLSFTVTFTDDYGPGGGQLFVGSEDVDAADFMEAWMHDAMEQCSKPQEIGTLLSGLVKSYARAKGAKADGNDTEEAEEEEEEEDGSDGGFDFGAAEALKKAVERKKSEPSPKRSRPDGDGAGPSGAAKELTADMFKTQGGSKAATERLLKDLKATHHSNPKEYGFDAYPVKDNLYHWRVVLFDFEKGSGLDRDLQTYAAQTKGKPEVELEVRFPSDYPFSPPFVRVVKPRFQFHTGHVTIGGSICMELLTKSGWSPGNDIESVIVQIRAEMYNGNARLDPAHMGREYTEEEAREAFQRVARQHNWRV